MKNTSKQRKLEYIREKNHYRLGGIGYSYFKISDRNIEYEYLFDRYCHQLNKDFKMKFVILEADEGLFNDDFINDLITVKFTFKRLWNK